MSQQSLANAAAKADAQEYDSGDADAAMEYEDDDAGMQDD